MESMMGATNNYEPSSDLIQEDECDTLLLYLPGFTKEQLRVQLTSTGSLKISGARAIGVNKWSSFEKYFPISANCDTNKISAKFEGGILYVRQPKLIVPAENEVKKIVPQETARPPTPIPKIDQQTRPEKPTQLPEKSDKLWDEKPTKQSQSTDKIDESKYYEKHDKVDKAAGRITGVKSERAAGNLDVKNVTDKGTKNHDKGKKTSESVNPNLADKATKYHDIDGVDDYNVYAGLPIARLKMSRQMITMGVTLLFSFLLGLYVRNLSWFSKNPGN